MGQKGKGCPLVVELGKQQPSIKLVKDVNI